ncbi:ribbon-helix-helix domain-containing protein [Pelagibacterium sp.]|uniref:ribbon-helix-helix domain-containing protein n=1 Tax=Pelagibacterium sp. TaxID=1967288 RepID=UPI003A8EFC7B
MRKRSLTIAGHRTSIALEPAFWDALEAIAESQAVSLPNLIAEIDETREDPNLSSAIRVYVLDWFRSPLRV